MATIRNVEEDKLGQLGVAPRLTGKPICLLKIKGKHDLKAARSLGIKLQWTIVHLPGKPVGKMKCINNAIRFCLNSFPSLSQWGLGMPGNIQAFWAVRGQEPQLRSMMKKINQRAYEIVVKEKGGRKSPKIDRHQIDRHYC